MKKYIGGYVILSINILLLATSCSSSDYRIRAVDQINHDTAYFDVKAKSVDEAYHAGLMKATSSPVASKTNAENPIVISVNDERMMNVDSLVSKEEKERANAFLKGFYTND